jgi:hypothetical protein
MTVLAPAPKAQFLSANGQPLVGGLVYTYAAGTTIPITTYTSASGLSANTNPIVLNARGEADIWFTNGVSYKIVLKDSTGSTIWTVDNVTIAGSMSTQNSNAVSITGGTIGSGVTFNGNTTGTASNVTGVVAVANGGTGSATAGPARTNLGAAASGANADITSLNESVTLTASGSIAATSIGFRGAPQNSVTANYGLLLSDNGKQIMVTTAAPVIITIPANSAAAFPIGATIVIYNNSLAVSQTIAITTDTLRQAGTTNTGSRTLANYGVATLLKVNTTEWVITGAGLT